MATLDDILTAQKNGVVALNNIYQSTVFQTGRLAGQYRSLTVTTLTEVARGSGIMIAYTTVVGGAAGWIYDSITPTTTRATGTGATATLTFSPNYAFVVGDTLVVKNIAPAGYQTAGTAVSAFTSNTVSYANATTGDQTAAGIVFNQKAANRICATSTTVDTHIVGAPFTTGLVIEPGAGQSINVIYSLDA
jgi:hypothetical protein